MRYMNHTPLPRAYALPLVFAFLAGASAVNAATPVAVWDSSIPDQGLNTTQGVATVFHIEQGQGNSFSNGKLIMGSTNPNQFSGAYISLKDLGLTSVSVLVKYSNFSGFTGRTPDYFPILASAVDSDNHEVGVCSENDVSFFKFYWQTRGGSYVSRYFASGPSYASGRSGYFLFSYSATEGVRFSQGISPSMMVESDRADYKFGGRTLTHVSIGGPIDSRFNDGWPNLVIEKVALFTDEFLSATDIESFKFPAATLSASEINSEYSGVSEIDLTVDDGTTINGDTTFTASKINFICDGSITVEPPANNTTEFDFSQVEGEAIISYAGTPPTKSGDYFTSSTVPTWTTDSTRWTNTIAFADMNIAGPNFNDFGNAQSSLKLSGVQGYIVPGDYVVPVVLENGTYDFALKLKDGSSPNNDTLFSVFRKISGRGSFVDGIAANGKSAFPVIKTYDADDFHGDIALDLANLLICDPTTTYSPSLYDTFASRKGSLRIESGKSATLVNGKTWTVKNLVSSGNLTVDGTLAVSVSNAVSGVIAGAGNVIAPGVVPVGSFNQDAWSGTVVISNVAPTSKDGAKAAGIYPFNLQNYGGTNSTIRLTSIGSATLNTAYLPATNINGKVVLSDDGDTPALRLSDGLSDACTTFRELAGDGTFININAGIYQGITINAMTNFTGKLLLNKMTVTFGTTIRNRQTDNWTAQSKLFIDPDAILSVPAGFALWSPAAVVFNGPVNFTTDTYSQIIPLFSNIGAAENFSFGDNAVISLNGVEVWRKTGGVAATSRYVPRLTGAGLVLKRKHLAFTFR